MADIDKILERYFEGETSLEEEKLLREYFSQADIPEQYKEYIPIFRYFTSERGEPDGKNRVQQSAVRETEQAQKRKLPLYTWIGIAASIVLLISLKIGYDHRQDSVTRSLVYINGQKSTDIQVINREALISIENISETDENVMNSQIGILDSFIK